MVATDARSAGAPLVTINHGIAIASAPLVTYLSLCLLFVAGINANGTNKSIGSTKEASTIPIKLGMNPGSIATALYGLP